MFGIAGGGWCRGEINGGECGFWVGSRILFVSGAAVAHALMLAGGGGRDLGRVFRAGKIAGVLRLGAALRLECGLSAV
ncbi:hypothetical protein GCM10023333_37850 [Ferrimonas pelagia]|uniref:Uncharacterized protein n=1 Tax=Ferrimonas pelagia TaxID=1177826 RepID=A0ABP9FFX4_9GAMM